MVRLFLFISVFTKKMKVRKTGRSNKVLITFGERTNERKISKISNLKTTSKLGQQITKGLYNKTLGRYPEDLRQVRVTIKGGYSAAYQGKLDKLGISEDTYYFRSFPSHPDIQWTRREILNHIENSMNDFITTESKKLQDQDDEQDDEQARRKGGYPPLTGSKRISEVEIDYLYR